MNTSVFYFTVILKDPTEIFTPRFAGYVQYGTLFRNLRQSFSRGTEYRLYKGCRERFESVIGEGIACLCVRIN